MCVGFKLKKAARSGKCVNMYSYTKRVINQLCGILFLNAGALKHDLAAFYYYIFSFFDKEQENWELWSPIDPRLFQIQPPLAMVWSPDLVAELVDLAKSY